MRKYIIGGLFLTVLLGFTIYFVHFRDFGICENLIKERLIDPASAQFSEIRYSPKGGRVCGYYNARNRLGGYGGKRLFMCNPKGKYVLTFNEDLIGKEYLLDMLDDAMKEARVKGVSQEEWDRRQRRVNRIFDYAEMDEWEDLRNNKDILSYCPL